MKKILLVVVFLAIGITSAQAQIAYGIKGGLNYHMASLDKGAITDLDLKNEMGFNLGAFLRVKVPIIGLYVQAEPTYTKLNSSISIANVLDTKIGTNRFDLPVLAGIKMLGLLRVYAGPVLSWDLGTTIDHNSVDIVTDTKSNMGGQAGVGVELGPIMLDARYEFGLKSAYELTGLPTTGVDQVFDSRANQLILGVAWKF